jgi:hypothetical protein
MKLLYTFLFILSVVCAAYSQPSTKNIHKQSTEPISSIKALQSFSISKIYPNPLKDQLTVNFVSVESGEVHMRLYNILGTEVKKWVPIFIGAGDQKMVLDLSAFKPGVYILKFTKSDQVATQVLKKY